MHTPRTAVLTRCRPATAMRAVIALLLLAVALPGQAEAVRGGGSDVDIFGAVSSAPVGGEVGTCHDWYASHNHMPGASKTLRVRGICTFPTSGYAVKLRRHVPQGINPNHLLLDKIVVPPSGPVLPVITDVEGIYEEVTDMEYTNVTILPDGPSIPVEHPQ
jgi:hypothetical protein